TPTANRPRSTERTQSSEIGPTCAATTNPSPKPAARVATTARVYAGERTRTSKGLAPHRDLNPARLPVPPRPRPPRIRQPTADPGLARVRHGFARLETQAARRERRRRTSTAISP